MGVRHGAADIARVLKLTGGIEPEAIARTRNAPAYDGMSATKTGKSVFGCRKNGRGKT
jgi:hypothetical protein